MYCVARDLEKWGKESFSSKVLMDRTFYKIEQCDLVLIEFTEKGVGLGIDAGFAYSKDIPVFVVAKTGSSISNTLKGIACKILFYDEYGDILI